MAKLDELQKLCEEATPGPWEVTKAVTSNHYWELGIGNDTKSIAPNIVGYSPNNLLDDLEFIAAARTYMPMLIEVAKAATAWDKRDLHFYSIDTSKEACALSRVLAELENDAE